MNHLNWGIGERFEVQPLRKPTLNPAWREFLGGSRKEVIHA